MVSVTPINQKEATCSVCGEPAFVECLLYDVYVDVPDVVMKRDFTCPFLCEDHFRENGKGAFSEVSMKELNVTMREIAERYEEGERRMDMAITHSTRDPHEFQTGAEIVHEYRNPVKIPPLRDNRGSATFPHTNRNSAQGFTIYRRVD